MRGRLNRKMRVVSIGAFWNNQGRDGIGLTFRGDDLTSMAEIIEKGIVDYTIHGAEPAALLAQLRDWAKYPIVEGERQLPEDIAFVAALNIAYLEKMGAIQPDEFNGMQYVMEYFA